MNWGMEIKGSDQIILQEKIESIINPTRMNNSDFFDKKLKQVLKSAFIKCIIEGGADSFYVEYTRGVIEKSYITPKDFLLDILEERIVPERRQGLDLTVLPNDFSYAFLVNHDGLIFSVTI